MKNRTSTPLLRASIAVVGTALLACAGPGEAEPPVEPPPVEMAATRVLKIAVLLYGRNTGDEPAVLTLTTVEGRVLDKRSLKLEQGPATVVDWEIDASVALPKRVRVTVAIPADDDPVTPSRNDLWAYVIEDVGELMRLVPEIYMPIEKVIVFPVSMNTKLVEPPKRPVYANTKGSHNYQRPPPPTATEVLRIELEGPEGQEFRMAKLRFVTSDPDADELHSSFAAVGFPVDVRVEARPGQEVPERFQLFIEVADDSGVPYTAKIDASRGETVRMVLRQP